MNTPIGDINPSYQAVIQGSEKHGDSLNNQIQKVVIK